MTSNHDELLLSIGRLEGKIDSLIQMQRTHGEELRSHDERIRTLEQSRSQILGYAAMAGGLVGIAANFIIKAFA
jgi:hypothetical protein